MNKEKEVMELIIDWWYKPTKVSTRKMFEDLAKSINNLYQAEIDKLKAENERLRLHVRVLENELVNQ